VIGILGIWNEKIFTVFAFAFFLASDHRPIPPATIMNVHKALGRRSYPGRNLKKTGKKFLYKELQEEEPRKKIYI